MYYCSPVVGERFYLWLLLISISGPISFEHLCTVAGTVYLIFQVACVAIGLLEDDYEWINCLIEAFVFAIKAQLCSLFVTALFYSPVVEPVALWDHFKQFIYNDLSHFLAQQPNVPPMVSKDNNVHFDYSLYLIY